MGKKHAGRNGLLVSQALTRNGAAELAGVTERAIRKAIARGELTQHPTADGRSKLLRRADVEQWAATTRKRGPKPASQL